MINNLDYKKISNNVICNDVFASSQTDNIVADNIFQIDGQIDDFSQGRIGDCWLLSGLSAMNSSQNGKDILEESIQENEDGSYSVTFNGLGKTYNVSLDEMEKAREDGKYSNGDDDVLLLEIAFEKVFLDMEKEPEKYPNFSYDFKHIDKYEKHILDGGNFSYVTYLLTGEDTHEIKGSKSKRLLDNFQKNPDDFSICASFRVEPQDAPLIVQDVNGNEIRLTGDTSSHALAVVAVDDETVTLVNPWDTSLEIVLSRDDFMKYATELNFHDY